MLLHESGPRIYFHYSYDLGWGEETRYSETKPTDPKARNIKFIKEGQRVDDPITHGGVEVAIFVHRHNGTSSIGPMGVSGFEFDLPIELEALPGHPDGPAKIIARENSD